jgi:hypothetical protein
MAEKVRFRWTAKNTAAFFGKLAATCDVAAAARAARCRSMALVYDRRRRDPEFVERWGEALALGYQMLETQLVGHALAGGADVDPLDGGACAAVNVELALKLLKDHRDRAGRARPVVPAFAAPEETNATLLAKLDQLERGRALRAAEGEGA